MSDKDQTEDLIARGAGSKSKVYGPETQFFVVGVHGTNNSHADIQPITQKLAETYDRNWPKGNATSYSFFNWQENSGTTNQPKTHRDTASKELPGEVLNELRESYKTGELDRSKPLVINLVGFSHGGNVALQAADDIANGISQMKKNGQLPKDLDVAIHMTTLSTPAYNSKGNVENPATVKPLVESHGVKFAHSHFISEGDRVVDAGFGNHSYSNKFTYNHEPFPKLYGLNNSAVPGVDNHGSTQRLDDHGGKVVNEMLFRFQDLAPRNQRRADAGDDSSLASINSGMARDSLTSRTLNHEDNPVLNNSERLLPKQFDQALKATGGDRDQAAVILETISKSPQFKPEQDISVSKSVNGGGLIVSQGQGDTAVNLAVPQASRGDYERISSQPTYSPSPPPTIASNLQAEMPNETTQRQSPVRS
jgi:hypothetical protein